MNLGDRMKSYEKSYDTDIIGRLPVIVRVDGKGFSKWTKAMRFDKPFDAVLGNAMSIAMLKTAEHTDGCVFGYTQSDEMTFVLRNDQSLESTPWFGNRIQKICSVIASTVTAYFNTFEWVSLAFFDTRVFAVPNVQEAINCLVWRQNDATKNSISAACYYEVAKITGKKTARKLMHGLNQKKQQELLFQQTGINWNDYPTKFKRGIGCRKETYEITDGDVSHTRSKWVFDEELPVFAREQDYLLNLFNE